jgi:tetratricopeptide (TPR) repeat protein
MKETSQKQIRQLFLRQLVERKLNNSLLKNTITKAGIFVCLFLFAISYASGQSWKFDENLQRAYEHALNLNPAGCFSLIKIPETAQQHFVLSVAEAVELLATESDEKFTVYEERFEKRLDLNIAGGEADLLFMKAELNMHWAAVYLKFGHELDAAMSLKRAYQLAETCRKKYPDFTPIYKTTGLLQIIIGSVPEKYNWVLGLFGMEGSIQTGLNELVKARNSNSSLSYEAGLMYALIQGFVLQNSEQALYEMSNTLRQSHGYRLPYFLAASLAMKASKSELAITWLDSLAVHSEGIHLHYADYLYGEAQLHKGKYPEAIAAYTRFLKSYKGQNYVKDALYKTGICFWLSGNSKDAASLFNEARARGKESAEADKHAAKSLAETDLPNIQLLRVRYFTDGGYFEEAQTELSKITLTDLPAKRDQVEFYYRKARLEHKQNRFGPAKIFYKQTIEMAGTENWYFAPNSCLQLGYIAVAEKQQSEAKKYFNKALDYKKHEYKNSIDSKAKSALAQLKRR